MNEIKLFLSQPKNTRILLLTSFLYAFVLPVVDIFVAAYIMRNSADVSRVVLYQLTVYTGIPITFLINGYLLNNIKPNYLYAFGMILSGVSMLIMTSLPELNYAGIGIAGMIMGMSFGFFWSNRDYLVLVSTNDNNRNYYYGIETFFNTVTFVVVPVTVGWFIERAAAMYWVDSINGAYRLIIYAVILLTVCSSLLISTGKYKKPNQPRFIYFKFHTIWKKMIQMAVAKGLVQGFIVTAPAMLIMKLVGEEGTLGAAQSVGSLITAFMMYIIGRNTRPAHRLKILAISLLLFMIGSLINSIFFNAASVLFFLLCMIVARPMLDLAYFPIQMKIIDYVSAIEKRNEYAYIFNHEVGLYIGRFIGCTTFILIAIYVSDIAALKITLPLVTILQGACYFIAVKVLKEIDNS
ncbi:MFS transporter [Parabacteroides sp. OttesenSCG-928-G06]|nr:MFS transporter [Parabacteroides sp. OttesenSCG-928-K15]MDL2282196.1 MFS transporter [Parabacteroides sp. OttesenSCG-928-G06]